MVPKGNTTLKDNGIMSTGKGKVHKARCMIRTATH